METAASSAAIPAGVDPVFAALHRFNRGQYDACISLCTALLGENPYDQAVWCLKCRAMTMQAFIDDLDFEEEATADALLDENATAALPRPGTSLTRPMTQSNAPGQPGLGMRPVSASGRPLSGFARPGTGSARPDSRVGLSGAPAGIRPGTSRPLTALGRLVRLGTASLVAAAGGPFINVDRLDLRKYAQRPALSRALFEYLLYFEHSPKKALELAAHCTAAAGYEDWWWKERLGKCYYQLGLYREAERQYAASVKTQPMVASYLQLANVSLRLDQPKAALLIYKQGAERYPHDTALLLGVARVHEALGELPLAVESYKRVAGMDPSNVEAIACIAANHFYSGQPELALRFYRRLLQMGIRNTELWCNLGLCCFHSSQYDMALSCLERALFLASDDAMADVWYNIGQVAIGIGDLGLAYQALKVAISVRPARPARSASPARGLLPPPPPTHPTRGQSRRAAAVNRRPTRTTPRPTRISGCSSCERATSRRPGQTFGPRRRTRRRCTSPFTTARFLPTTSASSRRPSSLLKRRGMPSPTTPIRWSCSGSSTSSCGFETREVTSCAQAQA